MVLSILAPVLLAGTMSMQGIVNAQHIWYIFVIPITAVLFFTSSLAEIGRSPFDLIEAESEIVAGFNIEYSGMKFGMFFAAEFLHAFTVCVLTAILFFGGWRGIGSNIEGVAGAALGFFWLVGQNVILSFILLFFPQTLPPLRFAHISSFKC